MSSWNGEEGHANDESPSRAVAISRAFAVGRFDVARGEHAVFVKATSYAGGIGCNG